VATQLDGTWLYRRKEPARVAFRTVSGIVSSPLPTLRIFFGTEEGRCRAERDLVGSVPQVHGRARTCENYVMDNRADCDRRDWLAPWTAMVARRPLDDLRWVAAQVCGLLSPISRPI
jgi:hypothetical protein